MKVSIITIVYNNVAYITDCIQSVLSQTYKNIEYIIIDGGSTDGSQEIIAQYQHKLAYYISEKDRGLYDALNKGIHQATGDIIGLLHSDDLLYENTTIKKIVDKFTETNSDLVYAKGMFVHRDDVSNIRRIYYSKPYKKRFLNFGWIPLHTTIFVKKSVFEKHGLYMEQYQISSDYDISLRWFHDDSLKKDYLDQWTVKMRIGGKSTTKKLQVIKSMEDVNIIKRYKLLGYFTLSMKIARKIPQYLIPKLIPHHYFNNNNNRHH